MRGPWAPVIVLVVGAVLATAGVRAQRSLDLREPLGASVPERFEGYLSRDLRLTEDEVQVAGVTTYLARVYESADTVADAGLPRYFSLYVGYYDRQTRGRTIHSPKNCLPGSGWEPLASQAATIETPDGPATVNRYLIQKGSERALVLYWYQGRGRVAHNEYAVKWDLLRDAALRRRSEEALVRLVVPISGRETDALGLAVRAAGVLVPSLRRALPEA